MAERIFDKHKPLLMQIYNDITMNLHSYDLVDSKANTSVRVMYLVRVCQSRYTEHQNLRH